MSAVDRQRIAAVRAMEALGYLFDGIDWKVCTVEAPPPPASDDGDAMHALLVLRADKLAGCTEGSEEATELKMIVETVSAYEAKRWPYDREARGKR